MTPSADASLYDRDPAAAAEVSVRGWVGAAWIASALCSGLALFGREDGDSAGHVLLAGLTTAALMGAALWAIGVDFSAAIGRLHRARSPRLVTALRIAVMFMYVASFMAATGLFILLIELP